MGEMISYAVESGGQASGYLAGAGAKGVVLIQEWWGLVPHIKDVAERLATAGYLTLAPDLWDGKQTTSPDEAGRLFMALNVGDAEAKLRGAVAELRARGATSVGIVGFCMGGQLALYAACELGDEVAVCVDFYGIHPHVTCDFGKLRAPVLGIFGADDGSIGADKVAALTAALGDRGEVHVYPGAGHAFFNDARPTVYNPTAAADAWQRTLAFLGAKL